MDLIKKKKKSRKIILYTIVVLLTLLCIILFIAVLSTCRPKDYRPVIPANKEEVSPYLSHKLAPDVYDKIQLDKPFELIIEQRGLNDIIARFDWPMELDGCTLSGPAITFAPDQVVFMGTIDYSGFPLVVTIETKPTIGDDGLLYLNLQEVYAGKVKITSFAQMLADGILTEQIEANPDQIWLKNLKGALLTNTPFKPEMYIYNHVIRITDSKIEKEKLTLKFDPVTKKE